jgi:hypothetical protein
MVFIPIKIISQRWSAERPRAGFRRELTEVLTENGADTAAPHNLIKSTGAAVSFLKDLYLSMVLLPDSPESSPDYLAWSLGSWGSSQDSSPACY